MLIAMTPRKRLCIRSFTGRYRSVPVGTGNNPFMASNETPGLAAYRRFLVVFGLVAVMLATTVGIVLLIKGKGFFAFLALCVVAFITLVIHGYRQEAEQHADE